MIEHENFHIEGKYQTVKKATLSFVRLRTIFPTFELRSDASTNHNGEEVKLSLERGVHKTKTRSSSHEDESIDSFSGDSDGDSFSGVFVSFICYTSNL